MKLQQTEKDKKKKRQAAAEQNQGVGINQPPKILVQDQNSYINNFVSRSETLGGSRGYEPINESSRTIEQQTLIFSIHTGGGTEAKGPTGSFTLLDKVNQMKAFEIHNPKQVRDYYVKRGMRLFFELNDHLSAYKELYQRERIIND